jgi:hypothetical protein
LGDLPEPPPEVCSIFTTLLDHHQTVSPPTLITSLLVYHLQFTREWEHLTKGAKIVDVSQAQITDKTGWSKEFIQENLAKATSVPLPFLPARPPRHAPVWRGLEPC